MADENTWPTRNIIAVCAGIAVAGAALYFIVPAAIVAFGMAVAIVTTGLSTAGVAAWVAPVASVGVATLAVTAAVAGLKKASESVKEKPYEWGLPLLGALGGSAITFVQSTAFTSVLAKWLFGGITMLWIVVAGACYKRRGIRWKVTAALLYFLPPAVVLVFASLAQTQSGPLAVLAGISRWTWLGVAIVLSIAALIGILAYADADQTGERVT